MMTQVFAESWPVWIQHLFWIVGKLFPASLIIACVIIGLLVFLLRHSSNVDSLGSKVLLPVQVYLFFLIGVMIVVFLLPTILELITSDVQLHDAYYAVPHWQFYVPHLVAIHIFALTHFLFPRLLRLSLNKQLAWAQTSFTLVGFGVYLVPQIYFFLFAKPLDYLHNPDAYRIWNYFTFIGIVLFVLGVAAFILMLVEGLVKRRPI